MAIDIVRTDDSYSNLDNAAFYAELQCEGRAEVQAASTGYRVGSKLVCAEDWSLWVLCRNGDSKVWTEVIL